MLNYTVSEAAATVALKHSKFSGKDWAELIRFALGLMAAPALMMTLYLVTNAL